MGNKTTGAERGYVEKGTVCICEHCGKEFVADGGSKGRFCSRDCRYLAHGKLIKESYTPELKEKRRELAKKQFENEEQRNIRRVSRPMTEMQRLKCSIRNMKNVDYKKIAIEAHGTKCQRCGKELTYEEVQAHHKNGEHYFDEITDNGPDNLMVLCRSCHTKLHHEMDTFQDGFAGLTDFKKAGALILRGLKKMGFKFDQEDENLDKNFKQTPERFGRAYYEIFKGVVDTQKKVDEILSTIFPSEYDNLVCEKGIVAFSMCPHHLLPVEYTVDVAYLTKKGGGVLGISKLARLVETLASAPKLQEDFTQEIGQALERIDVEGVYVRVTGRHFCMRMRGVKAREASVTTSYCSRALRDNPAMRTELMDMIKEK